MCYILPPYTLVPLYLFNRILCLAHPVGGVRRVHLMFLVLVPLARARITELSAAHRTLQSSATAAGRFYPYIQFHQRNTNNKEPFFIYIIRVL
jgi:hypothetical protein